MFASDRKSFENCSQLANLIRYQLGDPHEFINKNNCSFPTGSYFAYAEGNRDHYRSEESTPCRHAVNFSWIILRQQLEGPEKPSITSPVITINDCQRKWWLTINAIKGTSKYHIEYDVYLWCYFCKDASIRVYMKMDLYNGTDKIGEDSETRVLFDAMIDRHVVYTGAISRETVAKADLGKAYTIQGILNIMHCCVDEKQYLPHLESGLPTRH